MLKEIIDFSKKLEENGIYDLILKENQKIDKPIFVIPVNDEMTEIEIDKSYFVFKDIVEKDDKFILYLDGKRNKENTEYLSKEIKLDNREKKLIEILGTMKNETPTFQEILLNFENFSQKPSNDQKGNKSIGGNSGTNSYNVYLFTLKKTIHLTDKDKFYTKMKHTYTQNYIKGFPSNLNNETIEKLSKLFQQLSTDLLLNKFWEKIEYFLKSTIVKNNEIFSEINCTIKMPENVISTENFYETWYNKYLSKKLFKSEPAKGVSYPKRHCSVCGAFSETWLPNAFHNKGDKKPYLFHLDRKTEHNLGICSKCSFQLYKFQELFLNKKRISIFPLFIDTEFEKKEIQLLKVDLTKISFKEVVKEVVEESSKNIFDFYLIIYNREMGFLNFDYITGFEFYKNGKTIFEIEELLNYLFFDYKLRNNYFSAKVDTKNSYLDNLIYRFRTQIFDFVFRAKDSLNCNDISEMYIQTLQRKLRDCYDKEKEPIAKATIKNLKKYFLKLNETLGGDFMQTVERIKKSSKVTDLESLSYYLGQIAYYLLNQSKKENKSHAMIEPFINVANFGILGIKLEEIFNAYKHELAFNWEKLNTKFSQIWSFLYDNQDKEFNRDLKILFYAGYFDKNIFFESTKNENKIEGESK